jgi:spermidine synthase
VFQVTESEPGFLRRVAVLGLGVGTIAAYGKPGQEFDFYEIDPAMEQIARNPLYFTYLTEAQADTRVILGDARLRLQEAPDSHYQIIVADAFSSDAIPPHLLSVEAVQLMLRKTSPSGLLVFHISNRYLNLRPVLGNSAAQLQLLAFGRIKVDLFASESVEGKYPSSYVVMAREIEHLRGIDQLPEWETVEPSPQVRLWTDDFSSLFPILRFN